MYLSLTNTVKEMTKITRGRTSPWTGFLGLQGVCWVVIG